MFSGVFGQCDRMFKYSGLATEDYSATAGLGKGDCGSIYFGGIYMRPFDPYAAIEVHSPIRPKAWRLSPFVSDYRPSQDSGALVPKDGHWHSRGEERIGVGLNVKSCMATARNNSRAA